MECGYIHSNLGENNIKNIKNKRMFTIKKNFYYKTILTLQKKIQKWYKKFPHAHT